MFITANQDRFIMLQFIDEMQTKRINRKPRLWLRTSTVIMFKTCTICESKIVKVFLSIQPAPIQSNRRAPTVYERKVRRERSTSWRNSKADAIQISSSQDNEACLD